MGKYEVAFNGEPLFTWEGNRRDLERTEDAVRQLAERGNVTSDALVDSIVRAIVQKGGFLNRDNPQPEMMAVICFLFSQATRHPDHPGFYRDYLSVWNFDFDIYSNPLSRTYEIKVTGGFNVAQA